MNFIGLIYFRNGVSGVEWNGCLHLIHVSQVLNIDFFFFSTFSMPSLSFFFPGRSEGETAGEGAGRGGELWRLEMGSPPHVALEHHGVPVDLETGASKTRGPSKKGLLTGLSRNYR